MSDPKVTGPNMYYDRLHTNGDRSVTFAVDTIKVAGVNVDKKDMEAHKEAKIQVGEKPQPSKPLKQKPKFYKYTETIKKIEWHAPLLNEYFERRLESLESLHRKSSFTIMRISTPLMSKEDFKALIQKFKGNPLLLKSK